MCLWYAFPPKFWWQWWWFDDDDDDHDLVDGVVGDEDDGHDDDYVGDDERDIIAGRNAGMYTVAADFGFINKEDSADSWHADKVIKKPSELINLIV